jgi:hypothetical protein
MPNPLEFVTSIMNVDSKWLHNKNLIFHILNNFFYLRLLLVGLYFPCYIGQHLHFYIYNKHR